MRLGAKGLSTKLRFDYNRLTPAALTPLSFLFFSFFFFFHAFFSQLHKLRVTAMIYFHIILNPAVHIKLYDFHIFITSYDDILYIYFFIPQFQYMKFIYSFLH